MPDFREELYSRYVTTFKTDELNVSQSCLESFWAWYKYKYLPLLKGISNDSSILEVGCGPGYLLDFLKQNHFTKVEGIDKCLEQVNAALKRGLDVKVADVFDFLSDKENCFDVIIAIEFIEHFSKEELLELLKKMKLALKKKGLLIITTPNGQGLFPNQEIYGDFTHLTILSPESLGQVLSILDFKNIKFYETGPVPKNIRNIVRLFIWGVVKLVVNTVHMIESGKSQKIWTEGFICCCQKL